jgi:hypothetical protein
MCAALRGSLTGSASIEQTMTMPSSAEERQIAPAREGLRALADDPEPCGCDLRDRQLARPGCVVAPVDNLSTTMASSSSDMVGVEVRRLHGSNHDQ